MPRPLAVLVEDDPDQSVVSAGILEVAGFDVRQFDSIEPALDAISQIADLIDLFVLDRRLPLQSGELATDELGDEFMKQVRADFGDARIIVFTGYASVRHVQETLQGSGQLPSQSENQLDRVTVLEKDQSLEFRDQVVEYRSLLQSIDDIEIRGAAGEGDSLSSAERRVLRRVAFEYRAISVAYTALTGGLTGAPVWKCELARPEGLVAVVVAKQVRSRSGLGGLPDLLPIGQATSTVATVSGLMGGRLVNLIQVAGDAPQSLMTLINSDASFAAERVSPLLEGLGVVPERDTTIAISELCEPLLAWNVLTERLQQLGIESPAGTLQATIRSGMRHGDLHPANILIDGELAVLIDFDSACFSGGLLDPVTLLISTLTHPDSPIRGEAWPPVAEIEHTFGAVEFGDTHSHAAWFRRVNDWVVDRRASDREFWALSLAYAARQLGFQDVVDCAPVRERVIAIVKVAVDRLNAL